MATASVRTKWRLLFFAQGLKTFNAPLNLHAVIV